MYFIYVLRCEDDSLYTGITTDLDRRLKEHTTKSTQCAKYTRRHTVKRLEVAWKTENGRSAASKLEYAIKHLSREKKEELIREPLRLSELFSFVTDEMQYELYQKYSEEKAT